MTRPLPTTIHQLKQIRAHGSQLTNTKPRYPLPLHLPLTGRPIAYAFISEATLFIQTKHRVACSEPSPPTYTHTHRFPLPSTLVRAGKWPTKSPLPRPSVTSASLPSSVVVSRTNTTRSSLDPVPALSSNLFPFSPCESRYAYVEYDPSVY
jgi:hypothetical protein